MFVCMSSWSQSHWFGPEVRKCIFPEFSLDSLNKEISNGEKTDLLVKLCLLGNHCDFCVPDSNLFERTFEEYLASHSKSIKFVDLDHDGDQDVIFNGKECSGIDAGLVEIYENESDSLIRKFKSEGILVHFNLDSLSFVIYDYPCCAQQTHYVIEYKFDTESFTLTAQQAHLFVGNSTVLGGPYFPKQAQSHFPFTSKSEIALRWSANTTDSDPTKTCNNSMTNIICSYPEGSTGEVLYKSNEDWLFVRMDFNANSKNACEDNSVPGLKTIPIFYYGWIQL